MKKIIVLLLVMIFAGCGCVEKTYDSELAAGFQTPPDSAKIWVYWWWLNGYVSKDGIVHDLDEMNKQGISGALVFHAGGGPTPEKTLFMSPEWRQNFSFAVEEAAKRNITIGLNLCAGWNAGGPWVKPEDGVKVLACGTTNISGPKKFNDLVANSASAEPTYHDIAVLAWPVGPDSILRSKGMFDLTDKMDEQGRLKWNVPEGDWRIVRFGWKRPRQGGTKNGGEGKSHPEIDPLDAKVMDKHFAATAGVVIADVKPHVGKTFKYVHIDSGEIGHPDWTPLFREQFKRLRGYDPFGFMAARAGLIVDSAEVTEKFGEDYERTIGDLMIECYYGRLGELARAQGLGTHSEAAGFQKPGVDALRAMGCNDICMSEYWSRVSQDNTYIHQLSDAQLRCHDGIKNASSAGHIYGRKIVQAEAFTVIRKGRWLPKGPAVNRGTNYDRSFFEFKDIGDRAFCAGLNRNVLHQYMSQADERAKPGYVWPTIGCEFDRHSTLWPMGSAWLTYLARCQYLLQAGRFVGDVCYFQGDWAPVYVPAKWAMDPPLPAGYDCDTINSDAMITRATAGKDGRLLLPDGQSYRYLVLCQGGRWQNSARYPKTASGKPLALSPATLRKIKELVTAGVTVIGPRPVRPVGLTGYPESNAEIKKLTDSLWGKTSNAVGLRKVGKGRVIWGQSLAEVMDADGIAPDLEIEESPATKKLGKETLSGIPSPGTFDWIHRKIDGADVYFIANLRNAAADGLFTFRTEGKQPQLWDAVTGEIRDAAAFKQTTDGRMAVPLDLPPRGSIFVVFRKTIGASQNGLAETNWPDLSPAMDIRGSWTVRFDPKWSGPESVVFDKLEDWSKRDEPGIKFYSGTATYHKTFDLPEALRKGTQRVYLSLGKVECMAEIRLNGEKLGVVWTAPWQVDITQAIKPTGNKLEIDVVNLWNNRVVGDIALSPEKRLTKTNVIYFKKDSPLLPSGLLGPVQLMAEAKLELQK